MARRRALPATVHFALRPRAAVAGFLSLPADLHRRGYLLDRPRELRQPHPRRLELVCTFSDERASRRWLRDRGLASYRRLFAAALSSPPRVLPSRDLLVDEEVTGVCACAASPFFLLRGHSQESTGAVLCGGCGFARSNYTLPAALPAEVWASVHRHVFEIWVYEGPLAEWAEGELGDPDSELNRAGRRLARGFAGLLGAPVYLAVSRELPSPSPACPRCGRGGRSLGMTWPAWACRRCLIAY